MVTWWLEEGKVKLIAVDPRDILASKHSLNQGTTRYDRGDRKHSQLDGAVH